MIMSPSHHPWSHAIVLHSVTGSLDPWPHSPRCAVLLILYLSTMSCLTTVLVVQHECIPQAVLGMDIICQAKSGMGKTAVFVLATLHLLKPVQGEVHVVVLCHTRELAFQIQKEYERFSKYLPEIKSRVFYGGIPNCLHPSMHDPLFSSSCQSDVLPSFLWTESSFGWMSMHAFLSPFSLDLAVEGIIRRKEGPSLSQLTTVDPCLSSPHAHAASSYYPIPSLLLLLSTVLLLIPSHTRIHPPNYP